jgi:hypothetical protein
LRLSKGIVPLGQPSFFGFNLIPNLLYKFLILTPFHFLPELVLNPFLSNIIANLENGVSLLIIKIFLNFLANFFAFNLESLTCFLVAHMLHP